MTTQGAITRVFYCFRVIEKEDSHSMVLKTHSGIVTMCQIHFTEVHKHQSTKRPFFNLLLLNFTINEILMKLLLPRLEPFHILCTSLFICTDKF